MNVELDDARAYAEWLGWRLPTEHGRQLAAERRLIDRRQPLVWNLTESEPDDGRTRYVTLEGDSAYRNDASEGIRRGSEASEVPGKAFEPRRRHEWLTERT